MRLLASLFVIPLAISCSSPLPTGITWNVRFVCAGMGQRAEQVRVGIAPGKCPALERPVYVATVFRAQDSDVQPPSTLPPGRYAFYARAFDERGDELAQGCRSVTLPRSESVTLDLEGSSVCEQYSDDDGGIPDDGPRGDSEPRGTEDACPADPAKTAPGKCGCGLREPFDVAGFRDGQGYACSAWKGHDCTKAVEEWGYTQAQETAILANCSLTCARCP